MSIFWWIVIGWFGLGFIGMGLKILYWLWNGKRFNSESIHQPITLDQLIIFVMMGPTTVIISLLEIILLIFEKMGNIKVFK